MLYGFPITTIWRLIVSHSNHTKDFLERRTFWEDTKPIVQANYLSVKRG
jgi:hypothetical protein